MIALGRFFRQRWRETSRRSKILTWVVLILSGVVLAILPFDYSSGFDSPWLESAVNSLNAVNLVLLIAQGLSLRDDERRRRRNR